MINIKYTNGIFGGRRMGKEEIGKQIDSKKFSKTMRCYGDDKLGNIIKEIYFVCMREGYNLAKFRLEFLICLPPGVAEKYWDDNMENIRIVLSLCEQYEECE